MQMTRRLVHSTVQAVFGGFFALITLVLGLPAITMFLSGVWGFTMYRWQSNYLPSDLTQDVLLMVAGFALILPTSICAWASMRLLNK